MSPIIIECYLGTKAIRCSIMYYAHLASMKLERFTFHGSFLIMYVYVISVYNKSFAYVSQLIIDLGCQFHHMQKLQDFSFNVACLLL